MIMAPAVTLAADCSALTTTLFAFVHCMKEEAAHASAPARPVFETSRIIAPNSGFHYPQASSSDSVDDSYEHGRAFAEHMNEYDRGYRENHQPDQWQVFIPGGHGCQTGTGGFRMCW